jgi:hypothetical protein
LLYFDKPFLILDALLKVRRAKMPVLLRCACERISISSAKAESNADLSSVIEIPPEYAFTGRFRGLMCIKQMTRSRKYVAARV